MIVLCRSVHERGERRSRRIHRSVNLHQYFHHTHRHGQSIGRLQITHLDHLTAGQSWGTRGWSACESSSGWVPFHYKRFPSVCLLAHMPIRRIHLLRHGKHAGTNDSQDEREWQVPVQQKNSSNEQAVRNGLPLFGCTSGSFRWLVQTLHFWPSDSLQLLCGDEHVPGSCCWQPSITTPGSGCLLWRISVHWSECTGARNIWECFALVRSGAERAISDLVFKLSKILSKCLRPLRQFLLHRQRNPPHLSVHCNKCFCKLDSCQLICTQQKKFGIVRTGIRTSYGCWIVLLNGETEWMRSNDNTSISDWPSQYCTYPLPVYRSGHTALYCIFSPRFSLDLVPLLRSALLPTVGKQSLFPKYLFSFNTLSLKSCCPVESRF